MPAGKPPGTGREGDERDTGAPTGQHTPRTRPDPHCRGHDCNDEREIEAGEHQPRRTRFRRRRMLLVHDGQPTDKHNDEQHDGKHDDRSLHAVDPGAQCELGCDSTPPKIAGPMPQSRLSHAVREEHGDQATHQPEHCCGSDQCIAAEQRCQWNERELPEWMETIRRVDAVECEALTTSQPRGDLQVIKPVIGDPINERGILRAQDRCRSSTKDHDDPTDRNIERLPLAVPSPEASPLSKSSSRGRVSGPHAQPVRAPLPSRDNIGPPAVGLKQRRASVLLSHNSSGGTSEPTAHSTAAVRRRTTR